MWIIHHGTVVNEGTARMGYVLVDGTQIIEVGDGQPDSDLLARCDTAYDARGGYILPGVIDTHVHLREPGMTHKADIASESRAMARGGVTSWIDMPNVVPPTVTHEAWDDKMARAEKNSVNNYAFYIGATADNINMLARDTDYTRVAGVKAFLGSSTGGLLLNDEQALRRLFTEVPALIAVHCEDEDTIRRDTELLKAQWGDTLHARCHPMARTAEACFRSTAHAVALARQLGTRLHVLHISTARELSLFTPGKLADKRITAEACLGHLWFDDNDYDRLGNRIKVNPSIKTQRDRAALRMAVANDIIDTVATDHAPHTLDEKREKYLKSPSGMPLAQFSLVMMMELVRDGIFPIQQLVEKMSHAPAQLFGIERRGCLRKGYAADLTVVNELPEGHTVTDDEVTSKCAWTPLAGTTVHHTVDLTVVNGTIVHDRQHPAPHDMPLAGMPLRFNPM